ncbi:MAG: TRAP transporter small permease subunit [Alphaproteobacteria bacterium]|nr:TRAP transporter small permease subunit [Alphaproteobacteria bacterium SS10]
MVSRFLDGLIDRIGHLASWIWIILVGVIIFQVILRYVFNQGSIMLEEIQWHMYAVGFMIGLSYAIVHDRHVRIDIVYEKFPPLAKAWVDAIGILVLLLPFLIFVFWNAFAFVESSYESNEVSIAPDGLPYRWAIKSFIIIGFGLMILAALSRWTRAAAYIIGWRATPGTPATPHANDPPANPKDPIPHEHDGEFG